MKNNDRGRGGPQLVRPAGGGNEQWWFARLDEELVSGGSALATLYESTNPPTSDPTLGSASVRVYDFFLLGPDVLAYGTDIEVQFHGQYARWYVKAVACG